MDHAVPAELRQKVLARIDDDEVVRLACELIRIPSVQMVRRNLHLMTGAEPEHFGVRLPQSYAGNDTTHLWAAGIPCCIYGPGGGYIDYHDVHVELADLFLCTRVLALTALEAAL